MFWLEMCLQKISNICKLVNIRPVENRIMNSMTYVLYNEGVSQCILIDCGEYDALKPVLEELGQKVKAVLLTHGHSDHIYGLKGLLANQPFIEVYTNEYGHEELGNSRKNLSYYHEMPFTIDDYKQAIVNGGEILHFGGIGDIHVIACPGHDPSCLSYQMDDVLFTGDAYIPGVKVFAKFPGSNRKQAINSYILLQKMEVEGYKVYCGHHDYDEFVK